MRENFICTHFATSWNCKIGSKAHFFVSPPPHLFRPETHFFLAFPCIPPRFGHFFERSHPLFSPHSPFCTARRLFRFGFSLSSPPPPPSSPDLLPFRPSYPLTFTPPPLSFSFLPTFPFPSPINARTRARVRTHLPARQEVFVYCLHRFTHHSQPAVHQRVRYEGKREKAFTKHSTTSQSIY